MSKKLKIIFGVMFSFVFCFLVIGYASLTDTLTLSGSVEGDAQDNIFIVDVKESTLNVTKTSFYANRLLQRISLDAGETASYIVQLYNSSYDTYIFDSYSFVTDGVNVSVDEYIEENSSLVYLTNNSISSLIEGTAFDYFKVTYTNTNDSETTIEAPILFNYKQLTNQVKVELFYNDITYVKYADPIGDTGLINDVVFDQVEIETTANQASSTYKNVVARCNNNAIISAEGENGKYTLTLSNITRTRAKNSSGVEVEIATSCMVFDSLTEATLYNSGRFAGDGTPNNFIVLEDLLASEPTTAGESIEVWGSKDYSINLNSKDVIIHNTIVNDGKLDIYNESLVDKGSIYIYNKDLVKNVYNNSVLKLRSVNLEMETTTGVTEVITNDEYPAVVVSYEGLVEIYDCDIYTTCGYGIYKRPAEPGKMFRTKTSTRSKILVEESTVKSLRNNAIRINDGSGYVSLVDSYVASCYDTSKTYSTKMDPIFCNRHPLENTDEKKSDFDMFYRYASSELSVYVTGGTLERHSNSVNHFYSSADLNARIFYTISAKFKNASDSSDTVIHARTRNDASSSNPNYFPYPVAILNGNSAANDVYDSNGLLTNHYLNSDGWYYIRTADANVYNDTSGNYVTQEYINSAEYSNMDHNGAEIRVGNSVELINYNDPGSSYLYIKGYNDPTYSGYYVPLAMIPDDQTQAHFVGYDYEFMFLASGDENYYNIVSYGNSKNVFHIENRNNSVTNQPYDKTKYAVGVKYISTDNQWVEPDDQAQRFAIMKFNYESANNENQPYAFVSQFNSVLSFLMMTKSSNFNWNYGHLASERVEDPYFVKDVDVNYIQPGFIKTSTTNVNGKEYYTYSYERYLISNPITPNYQRNGWYLWQSDLFTETKYDFTKNTNILNTTFDPNHNNGTTVTLDSNATVYVSAQASYTNTRGIHLNSIYNNGQDDKDNYGYIRFTSEKEIYGLRLEVETINTTTNQFASRTPYLQFRTYNKAGDRVDYEILNASAPYGLYRPLNSSGDVILDVDENGNKGSPYYIIVQKDTTTYTYVITVIFDAKYSNYDLHSLTIDPFDDAGKDNTVTIKSITLIHPILNEK